MFLFRPYEAQDLNFIRSSWGYSFYDENKTFKSMSPELFHHYHRPIRDRILSQPTLAIIVCCSEKDPDQIIGWIAVEQMPEGETQILHYVYVKALYQKEGVAKELFKRAVLKLPVYYTHLTDSVWPYVMKRPQDFKYIPHLI